MADARRWVSLPAVEWALYDAPDVPRHLVATLVAVASFADEDGRGAYPSTGTVAAMTRKQRRATQNDLDELEKRGLLLPGDQSLAEHIRADRRPVVWDLLMSVTQPPRGAADDTPSERHGVQPTASRGAAHRRHGVQPTAPEQDRNKTRKNPSSPSLRDVEARTADRPAYDPNDPNRPF